ncbi:MAG: hypothetical protein GQ540_06820 [Lutibacter sp.]|uniref:hypothetical protein n=1 Tax=Lutibacter sp. TaxID=1925666 RepID=UPI0019DAC1D6|nr:hypothetical protein [Lutibacter sp.]NOR28224.1 hypothetical protein [Lutibacter sp.]
MFISKTENYTLLKLDNNSVQNFYTELKNRYSEFEKEHLIINFSEKINIQIEEIVLFLEISNQHLKNGTSFVLICKGINIDNLPEELNVAPTLTEAIDTLEMDAIERDLGF